MSDNLKRTNGFSWPPDKAQVAAWCFILYFSLIVFGSFCPSFAEPYSIIFSCIFAILFLLHTSLNVACMVINPGEEAALKRKITPQKSFDRTKHKHVIENQFCNICQIVVSMKAKHCKQCNKCITDFDHHCVYLNNCIGVRNYRIFILTICSAFLATLFIFTIGLSQFIASFFENQYFLTKKFYSKNSTLCNDNYCHDHHKYLPLFAPVPINLWRVFIIVTSLLALVAALLIGYLICYHIFLNVKKISTYEHTVILKKKMDAKNNVKSNQTQNLNNSVKLSNFKTSQQQKQNGLVLNSSKLESEFVNNSETDLSMFNVKYDSKNCINQSEKKYSLISSNNKSSIISNNKLNDKLSTIVKLPPLKKNQKSEQNVVVDDDDEAVVVISSTSLK